MNSVHHQWPHLLGRVGHVGGVHKHRVAGGHRDVGHDGVGCGAKVIQRHLGDLQRVAGAGGGAVAVVASKPQVPSGNRGQQKVFSLQAGRQSKAHNSFGRKCTRVERCAAHLMRAR